ncbi:DUF2726 domain-containing protein [Hydrogenophaga sp.]|uniref:DUF2726 domain-containing protein n=1 Tax=Hydrogenophaga sp. TaxID=1904254 RepID=UPI003F70DEBA
MDVLTITLVTAAAALVVLALGVWAYRRLTRPESSGRDDRYTPERVLTPEQAHMLDYLQDTFPGQVVLPNMLLKDMLTVRRASNRKRAEERLNEHKVDFVVCGEDGRPSFAFDVEQHHLSDARAKAHRVKMKNRILKTAGVRFVFLKNGIHRMPSPAEFRAQLNLAELPKPKPKEEGRESAMQQLESQFSGFDPQQGSNTGFRESEIMGMSGLMDLNRTSGRLNGNSGFDHRRGDSRFDGSSLDVRGGR